MEFAVCPRCRREVPVVEAKVPFDFCGAVRWILRRSLMVHLKDKTVVSVKQCRDSGSVLSEVFTDVQA